MTTITIERAKDELEFVRSILRGYPLSKARDDALRATAMILRALAAPATAPEPMFWVRIRSDGMYEGPLHNAQIETVRKESGAWQPLYLHPPATAPEPTTDVAVKRLSKALRDDLDYAWGWHCNIAMTAFDAGCPHDVANEGAARFMQLLAGVDTRKHPEFAGTQTNPMPSSDDRHAQELLAQDITIANMAERHAQELCAYQITVDNLRAELEVARKDAARYRELRNGSNWPAAFAAYDAPEPLTKDALDSAVDAALSAPATAPQKLDPIASELPSEQAKQVELPSQGQVLAAPEKTVQEIMEFARHYAANTFSSATLEDKIRRSLAAQATDDQLRKDAERRPMTPEQVTNMVKEAGYWGASPQVEATFINAIRRTETFHGIKGTP